MNKYRVKGSLKINSTLINNRDFLIVCRTSEHDDLHHAGSLATLAQFGFERRRE